MTDDATIWNRLAALIVRLSDVVDDAGAVRPESRLAEDLGISSLMAVELVIELEGAFQIVVREEDFDDVHTVGDLERIVRLRRAETVP